MTEALPLLWDGPLKAKTILILAHGAGLPMDSPFMTVVAEGVAACGIRVARFEFPYMAIRRNEGRKKPPDRAPVLLQNWRDILTAVRADHPEACIAIGGKSMGGRMASMIAAGSEDLDDPSDIGALVCLGYPFHPPGRPEKLRVDHLTEITVPTLIVQGERDPFGTADEVAGYALSPSTDVVWMPDGEHSFKPRKRSGHTEAGNMALCVERIVNFLATINP